MKKTIVLALAVCLGLVIHAQTPRQLWNQIPTAADSTSVWKTDTTKVIHYMETLNGYIARLDNIIAQIKQSIKAKEGAIRSESEAITKQYVGDLTKADVAARMQGKSKEQQKAEAMKMASQAYGFDMAEMQAMAKKMEGASEEQQQAMATQMMSGMDLSKFGANSGIPDDDKLETMEIRQKIAQLNNDRVQKQQAKASPVDVAWETYKKDYAAAYKSVLPKFEQYKETLVESVYDPVALAYQYRNFRNHYCPATAPVSLKYMNIKIAELQEELDFFERMEALCRRLAEVEPSESNRAVAEDYKGACYATVRSYAIELKRRYEPFFWLGRSKYTEAYQNNIPQLVFEPYFL